MSPALFRTAPILAALLVALAGCGGMTRTIGVLPNAADDLARQTEPFRAGRDRPARRDASPASDRRAEIGTDGTSGPPA